MDLDPRQYEHVAINENDVRSIVLSFLVHDCFKETAETFIACTGMKQPADYLIDMEKRKSIFHFALEGHALKAIELTKQLAHGLLEENNDLHFDLLSLHFVELVCSRKRSSRVCTDQADTIWEGAKICREIGSLHDYNLLIHRPRVDAYIFLCSHLSQSKGLVPAMNMMIIVTAGFNGPASIRGAGKVSNVPSTQPRV